MSVWSLLFELLVRGKQSLPRWMYSQLVGPSFALREVGPMLLQIAWGRSMPCSLIAQICFPLFLGHVTFC